MAGNALMTLVMLWVSINVGIRLPSGGFCSLAILFNKKRKKKLTKKIVLDDTSVRTSNL